MSNPQVHERLRYIDGLRAVSVSAVVVFHLGLTMMPQGFLGVDVFFVISGFVITRSLLASEPGPLIPFLERFYRRRFWRLVPALVAMVAVTLVAAAVLVPPVWISRHLMFTGIGALFGMSNLVLAGSSGAGYFDQEADFNPFLHTWSLGVEEQFYVLYPLILWVVLLLVLRRRSWARWILPALALVSLALAVWMSIAAPTVSFYLLPTRFWELAAGALAFTAADAVRRRVDTEDRRMLLAWAGLALVVGAFFLPKSWASPFPAGLVPVAGAVLLLWFGAAGHSRRLAVGTWLETPPVTYLGRISYSLYLWHWPVIVIMRWTIGVSDWWTILLAAALSLGLAIASYHVIEKPFQRIPLARWRLPSPVAVVAGVLIAVSAVSVYVSAAGTQFVGYLPSRSVTAKDPTFSPLYLPSYGWVQPAAVDDDDSRPTLLVVGDSHAGMYNGASVVVANELGYRFAGAWGAIAGSHCSNRSTSMARVRHNATASRPSRRATSWSSARCACRVTSIRMASSKRRSTRPTRRRQRSGPPLSLSSCRSSRSCALAVWVSSCPRPRLSSSTSLCAAPTGSTE